MARSKLIRPQNTLSNEAFKILVNSSPSQERHCMFLHRNISKPYVVHIRNLNLPIFLKTASSMPLKCLAPSFIMEANPGARPTFIAILKSSKGSLLALERTLQIRNSTLKLFQVFSDFCDFCLARCFCCTIFN